MHVQTLCWIVMKLQLHAAVTLFREVSLIINLAFDQHLNVGFSNKRPGNGDDLRGMEMEMKRRHVEIKVRRGR